MLQISSKISQPGVVQTSYTEVAKNIESSAEQSMQLVNNTLKEKPFTLGLLDIINLFIFICDCLAPRFIDDVKQQNFLF